MTIQSVKHSCEWPCKPPYQQTHCHCCRTVSSSVIDEFPLPCVQWLAQVAALSVPVTNSNESLQTCSPLHNPVQYLRRIIAHKHLTLQGRSISSRSYTIPWIRSLDIFLGEDHPFLTAEASRDVNSVFLKESVCGQSSDGSHLSAMAVETSTIRGPFNSVLNSARPTVCIKRLSECFDEWQLADGIHKKLTTRAAPCKTSPKQLTCKRVVKKYSQLKKSPSTEFKRKLFVYSADSPDRSPPPSLHPPPLLTATRPSDDGGVDGDVFDGGDVIDNPPTELLNGHVVEEDVEDDDDVEGRRGDVGVGNRHDECSEDNPTHAVTAENLSSANGKSLQLACSLVRRKYVRFWRKPLENPASTRRILKNVRLCDVFKPGSDKCQHGQLPDNLIIPNSCTKKSSGFNSISVVKNEHCLSEKKPSAAAATATIHWKSEDKNIFSLFKDAETIKTHLNTCVSSNGKQQTCVKQELSCESPDLNYKKCVKTTTNNTISTTNTITSGSLLLHEDDKVRDSADSKLCVSLADQAIDCLKHKMYSQTLKSEMDSDPVGGNSCDKGSHQGCFSEDSAFSSGSSCSVEPLEHVNKLVKVQETRRKVNSKRPSSSTYSYNYFTNCEQEGPRIRRRRTCPCCMSSSPEKKRRRRSRSCAYKLPGNSQPFVQNTLRLISLRNKLHLLFSVLFPKLYPFLESIRPDSEDVDVLIGEAISLLETDQCALPEKTSLPLLSAPSSSSSSSLSTSSSAPPLLLSSTSSSSSSSTASSSSSLLTSLCSTDADHVSVDKRKEEKKPLESAEAVVLAATVSVCKSPQKCLLSLQQKTMALLKALLPNVPFNREVLHQISPEHFEYMLDLIVSSNQATAPPPSS
ncbi:uncharacterized protein LOC106884327, partial [Argonauta hians]